MPVERRSDREAGDGLVTLSTSQSTLHYKTSLKLTQMGTRKEDDRETRGVWIGKQTPKRLNTAGDNWRDWSRTGMLGGIMLAAFATKALFD